MTKLALCSSLTPITWQSLYYNQLFQTSYHPGGTVSIFSVQEFIEKDVIYRYDRLPLPKIPPMCSFNATLFTNIIQTTYIFRLPYQGHYKTGANDNERLLEKVVCNTNAGPL